MRAMFCCLMLVGSMGAGEPAPPTVSLSGDRDHIDITLQRGFAKLFAAVTIGDKDVGLFVIDTGGERSLIDQALADQLGLVKSGQATVSSAGGQQSATFRAVSGLKIGDLTVDGLTMTAVDLSSVRKQVGIPFQGILGLDIWSVVPFRLELGRRLLTVFSAKTFTPPTDATAFELQLSKGGLWTRVTLAGDQITGVAIIDCGASAPLTFQPTLLAADQQLKDHILGFSLTGGVTGMTSMAILEVPKISMLGRTYDSMRTLVQTGRVRLDKSRVVVPHGVIGSVVLRPLSLTVHVAAQQGWARTLSDAELATARMAEPDLLGCDELMIAAYEGRNADCEYLLAHGANVSRKTGKGLNALAYAMIHAREDTVKLLIAKGSPVDELDSDGQTPLGTSLNLKMPAMEKLLREAGAKHQGTFKVAPTEAEKTTAATGQSKADYAVPTKTWTKGAATPLAQSGKTLQLSLPAAVAERNLNGISFIDASNGWVVGSGGLILATSDAGRTWTVQDASNQAELSGVSFSPDGHGWICGDSDPTAPAIPPMVGHTVGGRANISGTVRGSENGGLEWFGPQIATNFLVSAIAWDHALALAGTSGPMGHLDGDLWGFQPGKQPFRIAAYRSIYGIAALRAGRWIAVGSPRTVDFMPRPNSPLFSAGKARILVGTDGGKAWDVATGSEGRGNLRAVAAGTTAWALAVGDAGQILASTDQGATWKRGPSTSTEMLSGVAIRDAKAAVVVGSKGTLLATLDAGTTWMTIDAGTTADLHAVTVAGNGFIVVGERGTVLSVVP